MNNQAGNRDKKIAILLIAAFAWLFIGSLIIFHQEHVLGKHFKMNSQLFISPKLKDKKDNTCFLHKSLLKLQVNGVSTGILSEDNYAGIIRIPIEFKSRKSSSLIPDDAFTTHSTLRGPPEV